MTATNYAVAPGEYLEEWIEGHDLTQQQAADLLGSSRKQVNEIVNGRAPVTSETALRLERVVGIPAGTWLSYEARYRADLARIADEESLADHIDEIAPSAATYLRGIGATTATRRHPGKLVSDFLAFHRCGTWEAYEHLHKEITTGDYALATLKDSGATLDKSLVTTWLRAAEMSEPFEQGRRYNYEPEQLYAALPELRERATTPDAAMLRDLAELLASVGVVFMAVVPPKSFPVLGMTRWIDNRVPVIQQTGRWGKDGFVIWTLFHELGHVLNDPRGEMHLDYSAAAQSTTAAEKNANSFALDVLFGEDGMAPFRGLSSDGDILKKARDVGVAPGVAVLQMHRRRILDYRFGNSLYVDLADTFTG